MVIPQHHERMVPYDHSAEQAVLGSLLIDGQAIHRVVHMLRPEDFHLACNHYCYSACLEVLSDGDPVDPITVARVLARREMLDHVGGSSYLGDLINGTPTSVNVEHYAAIVAETAGKRRLFDAGSRIVEISLQDEKSLQDMLQEANSAVSAVHHSNYWSGPHHLSHFYDQLFQRQFDPHEPDFDGAVSTGFKTLDGILHKMQRSDLIIVGARPSVGKTSLALNIVSNAAWQGMTCMLVSLEMSAHQVAMRMLSAQCEVELHRLREGLYTEAEESNVVDSIGALSDLPIYLDDEPVQDVSLIRSRAQQVDIEHGLDLVVVDYLQFIGGSRQNQREDNRVQEISRISRSLKAMARELDVPVLVCSQLSRASELRANHRPQLSDLRDSGSIEQDADVVMFLYREDQGVTEEAWYRQNPGLEYPRCIVEVNVAKHRNGPTGAVRLFFREDLMRFYDIEGGTAGVQSERVVV